MRKLYNKDKTYHDCEMYKRSETSVYKLIRSPHIVLAMATEVCAWVQLFCWSLIGKLGKSKSSSSLGGEEVRGVNIQCF